MAMHEVCRRNIDRIVVMEDGAAEVHLIDGRVQNYIFPEFHPAQYKAERLQQPESRKKSLNNLTVEEPDDLPIIAACQNCGAEIVQKPKRKQRKFCCNECRNQWWNQHLDQVKRKSYYEITCQHCGKVTTVYGGRTDYNLKCNSSKKEGQYATQGVQ